MHPITDVFPAMSANQTNELSEISPPRVLSPVALPVIDGVLTPLDERERPLAPMKTARPA